MIAKLLVANRGEIALRVIRSAQEAGISCVAVCSEPDLGAPHTEAADEVVMLAGSSPTDTYLRADLLVDAADSTGADAVHPGYGFLSENAGFARACVAGGLTFVGPPADVIEAMGSKLTAKAMMAAAGVPVLPTIEIEAQETSEDLPPDLAERVGRIGFPVLVKASAGGGGRGMRVVDDAASLGAAVESAGREALSAFGDSTLFIEPYARRPRHIEVQVMADTHGNVVHLFERECSIQRRHQKIIEESPSPGVDEATRAKLCDAAVTAARAIGYVNVGTVEFLMLQDGTIVFLEMNTRLQVEHPVTELVTGLDLVRLQLLVAEGGELPAEALSATQHGHAIEARLYAEDPTSDWRPSVGRIHRFQVPKSASIRVDAGVTDGSVVSPWYDSMLAKLIAYAPTGSRQRGLWRTAWRARNSTGSPPTEICWSAYSPIPSSWRARSTPTSWCDTTPRCSVHQSRRPPRPCAMRRQLPSPRRRRGDSTRRCSVACRRGGAITSQSRNTRAS